MKKIRKVISTMLMCALMVTLLIPVSAATKSDKRIEQDNIEGIHLKETSGWIAI